MEDQVYRLLYEVENEHWWFTARKEILLRYLDARLPLPPPVSGIRHRHGAAGDRFLQGTGAAETALWDA
jgi:hypothetical protein